MLCLNYGFCEVLTFHEKLKYSSTAPAVVEIKACVLALCCSFMTVSCTHANGDAMCCVTKCYNMQGWTALHVVTGYSLYAQSIQPFPFL